MVMTKPRLRRVLAAGFALALLGAPVVAMPTQSFAEQVASADSSSLLVRGTDALNWGDSFECVTVAGLGASTLYADVEVNGKVVTKDIAYSYDSADDTFGMVQLNAKASYVASHSGQLKLNFYTAKTDDRAGADPVLSANVYAVCMMVDGQPLGTVEQSMIGIRTARSGEAELAFSAPAQIVRDSATYALVGSGKVTPTLVDGVLYVSYEKVDDAESVSGAVVYVDENGNELERDLYTIASSEQKEVQIRESLEVSGEVYTPMTRLSTVTLSADAPEQRVYCVARAKADTSTTDITLTYVSTEGQQLMVDRVSVGAGGFLYAPASAFSQANESAVSRYELVGATDSLGNEYSAEQAKSLSLTRDGALEYTLSYAPQATELTYTVNFALVSAGKGGNTNVSVAKSATAKVSANSDAVVELPETIEDGGVTYERHGSETSLSYTWSDLSAGRVLSDTVYYVSSDVVVPVAYDVTVHYVDAVSGTQIGSETLTCDPAAGPLSVTSPESLTYGDEQYERLGGQSAPITHRYYAPYRTYTVYYARPGSMTKGDTTITRTVVVDGGVRYYVIDADGNVTTTDNENTGGLIATAPYTIVTTTGGSDGDSASGTLVAPSGESVYEERISDELTPLASGDQATSSVVAFAFAAVSAGLLVLFALLILRKKRNSSDGLNDVKEA